MPSAPGAGPDAVEATQAEGEGLEPADSRKQTSSSAQNQQQQQSQPKESASSAALKATQPKLKLSPPTPSTSMPNSAAPSTSTTGNGVSSSNGRGHGLPSPDSNSFPKEPGLTHAELAARSKSPPPNGTVPIANVLGNPGPAASGAAEAPSTANGAANGSGAASAPPQTPTQPRRAPSTSGHSGRSVSSISPTSSISESDWSQPPTPSIPSAAPPTVPPSLSGSRRPSIFRRSSGKSDKHKDDHKSDDGHSSDKHKFTLKDLLASGPKLSRKSSQRSASSRKSDSDTKSAAGDSTASLLKKYGVCEKVAIGKGATSVVRLAHKWDRTEEKLYAVKEFRKRRKNETEKEYVKKLTAEFCISSTLHHVNVVETVDLVQDEAQHWCEVMEFCPGGDLYAAIKKGGMSPSEVECCFKQILSGVSYLHGQGVAHRDIKPENLLFDLKGHLKIGDFGASTVYRLPWEKQIHMSTGLCGSEPYIAPEQFLGKPYDARLVDVWACGIVYYCLHFQEIPWRVAQPADTLYAAYASACSSTNAEKSSCPPTINNLNPRACRPLIRKMLEPDPKKRWSVEDVVKHAWVEGLDVCYTSDQPRHIHVAANAIAQAQVK